MGGPASGGRGHGMAIEKVAANRSLGEAQDEAVLADARRTIQGAHDVVRSAVNSAMVGAYWELGRLISEAVGDRAEYGKRLIAYLAQRLTEEFGKGYNERELRRMR